MSATILIAGIGNIFQGDDGFGVAVAQRLLASPVPEGLHIMDVGIRSIDLQFALLEDYDRIILVDATARGGEPGTLYSIEIDPEDIPDVTDESFLVNTHALDPARVLSLARSTGAQLRKVMLIGCEPLVLDCDESGHIGLSGVVDAAVGSAVEIIRQLVKEFQQASESYSHEEEVLHESS